MEYSDKQLDNFVRTRGVSFVFGTYCSGVKCALCGGSGPGTLVPATHLQDGHYSVESNRYEDAVKNIRHSSDCMFNSHAALKGGEVMNMIENTIAELDRRAERIAELETQLAAKEAEIAEWRQLATDLLSTAEGYEERIDGEWGACRNVEQLYADGDVDYSLVAVRAALGGEA